MSLEELASPSGDTESGMANGEDRAKPRVLVIVPAYNESECLPELIAGLRTWCSGCDVVVIDDGSTDGTKERMAGIVRVVSLPCNLGIGGAVQTGLQIALREGYDIAVQVDGGGQHPPPEVHKLLGQMQNSASDLVLGSRFHGVEGYHSTATRRVGIRFFSWALSRLCHTTITDATSGFRAMNGRAIRLLAPFYPEDYPEVEALLLASRAGLRITEVPVQMSDRKAGRSSIGRLRSIGYMLKVPLAILMNLLRSSQPKPFD